MKGLHPFLMAVTINSNKGRVKTIRSRFTVLKYIRD